jgi:hypothetical protein
MIDEYQKKNENPDFDQFTGSAKHQKLYTRNQE